MKRLELERLEERQLLSVDVGGCQVDQPNPFVLAVIGDSSGHDIAIVDRGGVSDDVTVSCDGASQTFDVVPMNLFNTFGFKMIIVFTGDGSDNVAYALAGDSTGALGTIHSTLIAFTGEGDDTVNVTAVASDVRLAALAYTAGGNDVVDYNVRANVAFVSMASVLGAGDDTLHTSVQAKSGFVSSWAHGEDGDDTFLYDIVLERGTAGSFNTYGGDGIDSIHPSVFASRHDCELVI